VNEPNSGRVLYLHDYRRRNGRNRATRNDGNTVITQRIARAALSENSMEALVAVLRGLDLGSTNVVGIVGVRVVPYATRTMVEVTYNESVPDQPA